MSRFIEKTLLLGGIFIAKELKIKGLSTYHFRELQYFCLQYYEWKEKIKEIDDYFNAVEGSDSKKSKTFFSLYDKDNLRRYDLERKIELVENTAKQTDPLMYEDILNSVTQEAVLFESYDSQFNALRESFYLKLAKNKGLV